jgi:uncharacterized membrane protein YfbV (UPF0208 family)
MCTNCLIVVQAVMQAVCLEVCPEAVQAASQALAVQVRPTTMDRRSKKSTKPLLTNLFNWFFCICNIMSWHNQAMAMVSSGAFFVHG